MWLGPRTRSVGVSLTLLVLVASSVAVFFHATTGSRAAEVASTPSDAVRLFLTAAAIDNDGLQACRYLTPAARATVAARGGPMQRCSAELDAAALRLGGKSFTTEGSIDHGLAYSARYSQGRATVRISYGNGSRSFVLVPADRAERNEFSAPATPWRIAAGATAVVPRD